MTETEGLVQEVTLPPPRPSILSGGLSDQAMNNLPVDEVREEESYVGAWARSRADCFLETDAPPLAISAQRAESFGGLEGSCEFTQVQRDGAGWRTRARCSAHEKSWTANVQLRVTGSTLSWSSERGRATYYRCPPRVSATE